MTATLGLGTTESGVAKAVRPNLSLRGWVPAACGSDVGSVSLFGLEGEGRRARTYTGYDVAWAVEHAGARDAHALSCRFAVGLKPLEQPHWPVFLKTVQDIEQGRSKGTVQTMNRILGIVGLKLGVVKQPAADSDG